MYFPNMLSKYSLLELILYDLACLSCYHFCRMSLAEVDHLLSLECLLDEKCEIPWVYFGHLIIEEVHKVNSCEFLSLFVVQYMVWNFIAC